MMMYLGEKREVGVQPEMKNVPLTIIKDLLFFKTARVLHGEGTTAMLIQLEGRERMGCK